MLLLLWTLYLQERDPCRTLTDPDALMALPLECYADIASLLEGNRDAIHLEIERLLENDPGFLPRIGNWGVQVSNEKAPHLIRLSALMLAVTDHGIDFFGAGLHSRGMPIYDINALFEIANRQAYDAFQAARTAIHRESISHLTGDAYEVAFWADVADTVNSEWAIQVLNQITPQSRRILLAYPATFPHLSLGESNPVFAVRRISQQKNQKHPAPDR